MGTALTVRIDDTLDHALRELAQTEGLSLSELARRILEDAVQKRTLAERAGHLAGTVTGGIGEPGSGDDAWREQIRLRNWRQ